MLTVECSMLPWHFTTHGLVSHNGYLGHVTTSAMLAICEFLSENVQRVSVRTPRNLKLAIRHPFHINSWSIGCRLNRLDHPFRIISSRIRTAAAIRLNKITWGYLFLKIIAPLKRLRLSIPKKYPSVQTAKAICSRKIVIHSNSWSYLLGKIVIYSNGSRSNSWWCPFEKNTVVVRVAGVPCLELKNTIQLFERLLKFMHTKLIGQLIGQQYLAGLRFPNS